MTGTGTGTGGMTGTGTGTGGMTGTGTGTGGMTGTGTGGCKQLFILLHCCIPMKYSSGLTHTSLAQIRDCRTRRLIRVSTVCLQNALSKSD